MRHEIFINHSSELKSKIYLPRDYENSRKEWPIVLFLHGSGERGNNLDLVELHGIPRKIKDGSNFQFITVAPQCPKGCEWVYLVKDLKELLNHCIENFQVNSSSIAITGISMGGFGAYALASYIPELISSIVVVCGWLPHDESAKLIGSIPVWHIHGEQDNIVPIEKVYDLSSDFEKVNKCFKLTLYPNVGHNAWDLAYDDKQVYKWLLNNRITE